MVKKVYQFLNNMFSPDKLDRHKASPSDFDGDVAEEDENDDDVVWLPSP